MIRLTLSLSLLAFVTACADGRVGDNPANSASINEIADERLLPVDDPANAIAFEGAPPTDAWIGRWTGVEGLAIDIQPNGDRAEGLYNLTITTLDGTNRYEGRAAGEVIAFERNGETQAVREVTGDETGLRYLAGKRNCLMTIEFEGFCRD